MSVTRMRGPKGKPKKKTGIKTQDNNLPTKKIEKMKTELNRNPNNQRTAQRLAELKQMHSSKLKV